ncbi:MAG TPA: LacI family DNA-binding transcriptional regulator [Blastocatellia bacterium]|nr:LacI family DNA-binding transcriptional regulator [Blastocatellia bacterium]
MPQKRNTADREQNTRETDGRVSLKMLADKLGLSTTTVSLVLNDSPAASAIPQQTKDRVFAAAKFLNYRPNYLAKSLRAQRSFTVGVIVPELSDGYSAMVLSGVEDYLLKAGYFYFVASHRHQTKLIEEYPHMLFERRVEGLIVIDTPYTQNLQIPVVAISGSVNADGVTSIALDHEKAAMLALQHLKDFGHRRIAFIKGQTFSSDTAIRWKAITKAAKKLGLTIQSKLVSQLEGNSPSPELGYVAAQGIIATGAPFTALFTFNDVSAIGAARALREAGLSVPEDVSIIGFDDVYSAAYQNPPLTTVRQPLWQMGKLGADTILKRITTGSNGPYPKRLTVEPELVIRQSTAIAPSANFKKATR